MLVQLHQIFETTPDHIPLNRSHYSNNIVNDLNLPVVYLPSSRDAYQRHEYAKQILDGTIYNCDFEQAIFTLVANGFTFNEAVSNDQNTIVHWLVLNAPIHVLTHLLFLYPNMNINVVNSRGETPLMIAASMDRQQVVNYLVRSGASPFQRDAYGFTAVDHAVNFPKPIHFRGFEPIVVQSIYQNLFLTVRDKLKEVDKMPVHMFVEKLFELYIAYIRQQGWQYEGVVDKRNDYDRLMYYILDCRSGVQYKVNCFDVANGFLYLLKAFGIKDVKLHFYENGIQSKPFTPKDPKIQGEFVCFDREAHLKILAKANFYSFRRHCVVVAVGKVYDPTFCCRYDNLEDVLYVKEQRSTLQSKALTFAHAKRQKKPTPAFLVEFTRKLRQSIFSPEKWNIVTRNEKVVVRSKISFSHLEMLFANNLLTFSIQHKISAEMMSQVMQLWKESLPKNMYYQYDVFSIKQGKRKIENQENNENAPPMPAIVDLKPRFAP